MHAFRDDPLHAPRCYFIPMFPCSGMDVNYVPHSVVVFLGLGLGLGLGLRLRLGFFVFLCVSGSLVPIVRLCMVAVIIYDSFCPHLVSYQCVFKFS